jgi:hypothetical protein
VCDSRSGSLAHACSQVCHKASLLTIYVVLERFDCVIALRVRAQERGDAFISRYGD